MGLQTRLFSRLLFLTGILSFTACVVAPVPIEDYALARAALAAAKAVDAAKYSPGHFHKAETAYKRAENLLQTKETDEAQLEFINARQWAEKAENSARLIRFKNGEVL